MNGTLYVKRFESNASLEVSEDIILPDYLPEVRRVVGVRSFVTTDGKYLSGEELEADGSVVCTVIYTSSDGSLAQVSESMAYTGHIPLKNDDDRFGSGDIVLSACADNVTCRVTAPRKITLSAKVKLSAVSEKSADASLRISDAGGDAVVRRKVSAVKTGYMNGVRQSGECEGEIREREGMKPVFASGNISVSDVRMVKKGGADYVCVKGEVSVNLLLLSPEGAYVQSRGRTSFEEEIPGSAADGENIDPTAFCSVVMLEVDGGEDGIFRWKAEYDVDCVLIHGREAEITDDAYLTEKPDTLTRGEFRVCAPAAAVNGRLTTSAQTSLRPDTAFVCAWGSASADKAEIALNKVNITGSVRICVVTVGGGEFYFDETSVPLKYTGDALCASGVPVPASGRMEVEVCDITARADGNTLSLTAELFITAALLTEEGKTAAVMLEAAEGDAETAGSGRNRIRVYVPDSDEGPWDVEKKFRLGHEAVREGDVYVI